MVYPHRNICMFDACLSIYIRINIYKNIHILSHLSISSGEGNVDKKLLCAQSEGTIFVKIIKMRIW